MISPWLTFSRAGSAILAFATLLPGASIAGRIELAGAREAVAHAYGASKVVVWLTPVGQRPVPAASANAVMLQKGKQFLPHVLAIEAGTTVNFPNLDSIFHNAFSSFDGQIFDIGLYPPGSSRSIRFHRPGIVRVFCNIHPAMSAVIVVLDTPYFTTPSADGSYTIDNIPPGEYRVSYFHEQATPETLDALSQLVSIGAPVLNVPVVRISVADYIAPKHKNKYGQDYPAPSASDYPVAQ